MEQAVRQVTESLHDSFGNSIPEWYAGYVKAMGDRSFDEVLQFHARTMPEIIAGLSPTTLGFAYAEGKWTVAEVLLHLIDCERIFVYRALRIARGDKTPLPGFDENLYVPNSGASARSAESLVEEYHAVRQSTLTFFRNLDAAALQRIGTANG
ncbi:MAG: DinB family protein, partial [Bacteroidota bacterium]